MGMYIENNILKFGVMAALQSQFTGILMAHLRFAQTASLCGQFRVMGFLFFLIFFLLTLQSYYIKNTHTAMKDWTTEL
jgi:hypothetical protein